MADVEAAKYKTANSLVYDLEEFIRSNRHRPEVALRWLAQYLDDAIVPIMRAARADNYDDASKQQIAAFRLREIADERSKREREIADLDREANKLKTVV